MNPVIQFFKDFFSNYLLMSALSGWFIAQIVKTIICLFNKEKVGLSMLLFSNGGMPSSHSATVMALCTASFIHGGAASPTFAISLILASVVMIDASGVRYETGKQAQILNKITRELFSGKPEEFNTGLKELVGHTPFQVLVGAALGIVIAIGMSFIMTV